MNVAGWHEFIEEFNRDVWPLFAEFGGVSKGEAMILWQLNRLWNQMLDVEAAVLDVDREDLLE